MRGRLRALHIVCDRAYDGNHNLWPQLAENAAQAGFALAAGLPSRRTIQPVYRLATQIYQVAAQIGKGLQEILLAQAGKSGEKYLVHGAVKPGIRLIEKSPRGRRGFPDE